MGRRSFRQYRRAGSGADAAVNELQYMAVMFLAGLAVITAPIWIPLLAILWIVDQFCSCVF